MWATLLLLMSLPTVLPTWLVNRLSKARRQFCYAKITVSFRNAGITLLLSFFQPQLHISNPRKAVMSPHILLEASTCFGFTSRSLVYLKLFASFQANWTALPATGLSLPSENSPHIRTWRTKPSEFPSNVWFVSLVPWSPLDILWYENPAYYMSRLGSIRCKW